MFKFVFVLFVALGGSALAVDSCGPLFIQGSAVYKPIDALRVMGVNPVKIVHIRQVPNSEVIKWEVLHMTKAGLYYTYLNNKFEARNGHSARMEMDELRQILKIPIIERLHKEGLVAIERTDHGLLPFLVDEPKNQFIFYIANEKIIGVYKRQD